MDFLDPLYRRRHTIRLYTGYVLVAIAIFLAVFMLLLVTYGYEIGRNGRVIQNGLLFVSSKPAGAQVAIDGVAIDKQTNTRFNLAEGNYELQIQRDGYRSWQRHIQLVGGQVLRYDYPILYPEILSTTSVKKYSTAPQLATQSPNQRWLLVQPSPELPSFHMYDLGDPETAPETVTLPTSLYTASSRHSWQTVEWASNNVHMLLKHTYGTNGAAEFILLDRERPSESRNLNRLMDVAPTKLELIDSKFDRYYVYSAANQQLLTATIDAPIPQPFIRDVIAYEPYKNDDVLYVTAADENPQQVEIRLRTGDQTYTIREQAAAKSYHIALTSYSGDTYVAVADPALAVVAVYKNPVAQLASVAKKAMPIASLKLKAATYLSFSGSGQYLVAENTKTFATYDAEYKQAYGFTLTQPIDKGQPHATWMDGAHLQYVSNKQLYVFDYDGNNRELLVPAITNKQVFYDKDYRFLYTLAVGAKSNIGAYELTSTALRIPADL